MHFLIYNTKVQSLKNHIGYFFFFSWNICMFFFSLSPYITEMCFLTSSHSLRKVIKSTVAACKMVFWQILNSISGEMNILSQHPSFSRTKWLSDELTLRVNCHSHHVWYRQHSTAIVGNDFVCKELTALSLLCSSLVYTGVYIDTYIYIYVSIYTY